MWKTFRVKRVLKEGNNMKSARCNKQISTVLSIIVMLVLMLSCFCMEETGKRFNRCKGSGGRG